jgi:FtsP/CotA-like multicopper oxidase with cupredoxin domain
VYVPAVVALKVIVFEHGGVAVAQGFPTPRLAVKPEGVGAAHVTLSGDGPPFCAVAVTVTLAVAPLRKVTVATLEVTDAHPKVQVVSGVAPHAELSNVEPVTTVSATGVVLPFWMVTQMPPETLVPEQPVWKDTLTGLPATLLPTIS